MDKYWDESVCNNIFDDDDETVGYYTKDITKYCMNKQFYKITYDLKKKMSILIMIML